MSEQHEMSEKKQEEKKEEKKVTMDIASEDEDMSSSGGVQTKPRSKSVSRTKSSKGLTASQLADLEEERVKELEEAGKSPEFLAAQKRESLVFCVLVAIVQLAIIVIFGAYTEFPHEEEREADLALYGYFRDVNIMIFFGFGFLMTFLRRYGYSAIGYTLFLSALVTQYSVILRGLFQNFASLGRGEGWSVFPMSLEALIDGLFCSGAVMISFGAILGKTSPTQLLVMALIEPWFFFANLCAVMYVLEAHDAGGGMTIHTLGGYYGLVVTWFLTSPKTKNHQDNTSNYSGDIFSLAGTLFLWLLWPSFNAAIVGGGIFAIRALINTFLSITSSTLSAFIVSRLLSGHKFEVVHIQNSTLAGGVVMGVAADLNLTAGGAAACGFFVGAVSVFGYAYITPFLAEKLRIQDICGVHNLHALPGFLSGIVGIFATISQPAEYEFPKNQPGIQTAALFITLGFALVGGLITGIILKFLNRLRPIPSFNFYNDRTFWSLPTDYYMVINRNREE